MCVPRLCFVQLISILCNCRSCSQTEWHAGKRLMRRRLLSCIAARGLSGSVGRKQRSTLGRIVHEERPCIKGLKTFDHHPKDYLEDLCEPLRGLFPSSLIRHAIFLPLSSALFAISSKHFCHLVLVLKLRLLLHLHYSLEHTLY